MFYKITKNKWTASLVIFFLVVIGLVHSQREMVILGRYALKHRMLQGVIAKEACTCIQVMDYGPPQASLDDKQDLCLSRNNLPIPLTLLKLLMDSKHSKDGTYFLYDVSWLGSLLGGIRTSPAMAIYKGEGKGCQLLPEEDILSSAIYQSTL